MNIKKEDDLIVKNKLSKILFFTRFALNGNFLGDIEIC